MISKRISLVASCGMATPSWLSTVTATASGPTVIGTTVAELLLAKALWRRRKRRVALYVVPLKSLVEEKVGQFAKLWSGDGSYGWRVRACL